MRNPLLAVAFLVVLVGGGPSFMPPDEPGRQWTIRDQLPRLKFQNPMFAVVPPRGPREWFIGEREGRILAVPRGTEATTTEARVVLDLRGQTLGWQDCGLLNLVFHPEFGKPGSPHRGDFFVWYNYIATPHPGPHAAFLGTHSHNRLSRFTLDASGLRADIASERVLIEQLRTNLDHHGGGLFFHPGDGFLYIGVGDGGHQVHQSRGAFLFEGADDPQRIDRELLSGVLRIDVDCRGPEVSHPIRRQPRNGRTHGYCVPNDNPWLDPAGTILEEFFAIGLRSPHRMSYDPESRRIFLGEIGESRIEEVNVIERGGNYQWNYREGYAPFKARPAKVLGTERAPLIAYPHRGFTSVMGGFVYHGRKYPELRGRYIFGDTGSGHVWSIDARAQAPVAQTTLLRLPQEMTAYSGLSSFAQDEDGEIYLCILGYNEAANGSLQRLERAPASAERAPATLSETRLFRRTSDLQAAKELFAYTLNVPFWSDHAVKSRWLHVPPGKRVTFRPAGEWAFPPGTIAVKHFDIELDEGDPSRKRRLETRVLVLDREGGAYGRIYKWRADQREADLMTEAATELLTRTSRRPFGPLQAARLDGQGNGTLEADDDALGLTLRSPVGGTLFAHLAAEHDFDVAAAFSDLTDGRGGLMLREGLGEADPYLFAAWDGEARADGTRTLHIEVRDQAGRSPVSSAAVVRGPWIRVNRVDDEIAVFAGEDGHLWTPVPVRTGPLAGVHLGLAVRADRGVARARVSSHVTCEPRDHYYPNNEECLVCHTRSAGWILGGRTHQWNLDVDVSGRGAVNQLVLAHERGIFDRAIRPEEPTGWKKLVALDDTSASLEARVRSYLDANCAQCHRPGSLAQVGMDLRFDTPLEKQGLVRGRLRWPPVPDQDNAIVTPRDLGRSRLFDQVASRGMPPLGSRLTHTEAVDVLRQWIMGMDGRPALEPPRIRWSRAAAGLPARVEITHPDPEATIYFTTDGTGPGPETTRYTVPFEMQGAGLIRAMAFREGFTPSLRTRTRVPDEKRPTERDARYTR